jgi:hypothetical protein
MDIETMLSRGDIFVRTLSRKARPAATVAAAILVLIGMDLCRRDLRRSVKGMEPAVKNIDVQLDESSDVLDDEMAMHDLKAKDIRRFKTGLLKLTASKRALYENGLEIQEEQRLLEKQWEILTTYLMVDEAAKKISLMRGSQALESYPIAYDPPRVFGGEAAPLPESAVIVSKERYANTERGKSEEVNGHLEWIPPQVGTSIRANALGEFVMFTNGPLILHGPPRKQKEHGLFPHDCLGLSLYAARRLYEHSFIGTKIIVLKIPAIP